MGLRFPQLHAKLGRSIVIVNPDSRPIGFLSLWDFLLPHRQSLLGRRLHWPPPPLYPRSVIISPSSYPRLSLPLPRSGNQHFLIVFSIPLAQLSPFLFFPFPRDHRPLRRCVAGSCFVLLMLAVQRPPYAFSCIHRHYQQSRSRSSFVL